MSTSQVMPDNHETSFSQELDTHSQVRLPELDQQPTSASCPKAGPRRKKELLSPALPTHCPTSARKHKDPKPGSRPQQASGKKALPPGVVKVIPVSGTMEYPPFYVVPGSTWNILFVNLSIWLPELKEIELAAQDTVMIQYRTENGWMPLAGDEQLRSILSQFLDTGSILCLRCAPGSEFISGSEPDETGRNDGDILQGATGYRGSKSALREHERIVSKMRQTSQPTGFPLLTVWYTESY
jgi:hypothetical protein